MTVEALSGDILPLADVLREMDINFLVSGDHQMTVEEAVNFLDHPHFLFLDVRTKEEREHLVFPFTMHIPINELPDRLDELPRDKFIITFCLDGCRAVMAYAYLRTQGFDECKPIKERVDRLAGAMNPGRFQGNRGR
jgi:rhodanese-related sulfurtransferase